MVDVLVFTIMQRALIGSRLTRSMLSMLFVCGSAQLSLGQDSGPLSVGPQHEPSSVALVGVVLDRITKLPVPGADVTLMKFRQGPSPPSPVVKTSSEGRFEFPGLSDGEYILTAKKSGYSQGLYNSNPNLRWLSHIKVSNNSGGKALDVTMYLDPGITVSGKVKTGSGVPLTAADVLLFRKRFGQGVPALIPTGSTTTNAQGEYSFDGMAPDEYVLFARPLARDSQQNGSPKTQLRIPKAGFYPKGGSFEDAVSVSVIAGANMSGADIALEETQGFRVSGEVIATEVEPRTLTIQLRAASYDLPNGPIVADQQLSTPATTRFQFDQVPKGLYTLLVVAWPEETVLAERSVNVSESDISNVHLNLSEGLVVTGLVKAEASSNSAVVPIDVTKLGISLTSFETMMRIPPNASPSEEGRFTVRNLIPGRSILGVSGLPQSCYIKCISVTRGPCISPLLRLTYDTGNTELEITIASPASAITGEVKDNQNIPIPSATITLVPRRPEQGLMITKLSNSEGAFSFNGLAPGSYILYSWAGLGDRGQDPMLLSHSAGTAVDVHAGETIHKKLVPSPY